MRYIAFLRAINVGGHTVTMAELKKIFESLGFKSVETFIASGNVIFDAPKAKPAMLEKKISDALEKKLGYEVGTFLRSESEIAAVATRTPFPPDMMENALTLNVAFANTELDDEHRKRLEQFNSEFDNFVAHGREVYWRATVSQNQSRFASAKFEKALGIRATWRNLNTVRRLAAKYPETNPKGKSK